MANYGGIDASVGLWGDKDSADWSYFILDRGDQPPGAGDYEFWLRGPAYSMIMPFLNEDGDAFWPPGPRGWANPSYFMNDYDGYLALGFAELVYWRVWVYPKRYDFGFAEVGTDIDVWVICRYDEAKSFTAVTEEVDMWDINWSPTLPVLPLTERLTTITIDDDPYMSVKDSLVSFTISGEDAVIYLSAFLALLFGGEPSGVPLGAGRLSYTFDTQVSLMSDGVVHRESLMLKPVRVLSVVQGTGDEDDLELLYASFIESGQKGTVLPVGSFWEPLTQVITAGDSVIYVEDETEFEVGGSIYLKSYDHEETFTVSGIAAGALTIDGVTTYGHPVGGTKVFPCITGIGTLKKIEMANRRGITVGEIEVVEKVVSSTEAAAVSSVVLDLRPEEHVMQASLNPSRAVSGAKMGVPDTTLWNETQRTPMAHAFVYLMHGTQYRELRDAFVNCRGRGLTLRVPTWKGDLEAYETATQGSSSLKVSPSSYADIADVYDYIMLDWTWGTQVVEVTSSSNEGTHALLGLGDPLDFEVPEGAKIHLVPLAAFSSDSLKLDFGAKGICSSRATFIEVVR